VNGIHYLLNYTQTHTPSACKHMLMCFFLVVKKIVNVILK